MSQLLFNESAWNPTQMKSQKMKLSNAKRQSIKLKIELPSYTSSNPEDEHDRLNRSQLCTSQIVSDDEDDYQNATIRLEISFDTRQTPKRFKKNECFSAKKVSLSSKKAPSLVTSGYSSSNSSMINYVQDKSFYMEDEYNHINVNENIYDKLDYKRRSLASTNSSMSSALSVSSSSSSSSSSKDNYEEISNFGQLKPYENDSSKSVKSYKREYTINEIFQNLKAFKSEAKQLEMLNSTTNTTTCYTDIKPPKTVSFLKQIFESKSKKTPTSTTKQSKDNTSKLQFVKTFKQQQEHVYVNEKISRPINV